MAVTAASASPTASNPASSPATAAMIGRGGRRRLRRAAMPLLLAAALLVIDLARPPARQASARLLLGGIHLYQATLSPRLAAFGVQCRFPPTCSHYAEGAIVRYGALSGSLRAACWPTSPSRVCPAIITSTSGFAPATRAW